MITEEMPEEVEEIDEFESSLAIRSLVEDDGPEMVDVADDLEVVSPSVLQADRSNENVKKAKKKGPKLFAPIYEWRSLQAELKVIPSKVEGNLAHIQNALSDYRLTVIGLTYKSEKVDEEVWSLYSQILLEIPSLKEETFKRSLAMRTRGKLKMYLEAWKQLVAKEELLLDTIAKASPRLESYNNRILIRQKKEEEQARLTENERKIASARRLLEIALTEIQEKNVEDELLVQGSQSLKFQDVQAYWQQQLEEIKQIEHTGEVNNEDLLLHIHRLEQAVREAPASARWIRATEDKFAKLIAKHELLLSLGKSIIPNTEIARTTVMMYEQVPKLWASGNNEELSRTLQGLERFVSYYESSVQTELDLAERRRPGITRALSLTRAEEKGGLSSLVGMVRSLVNAIDSRDSFMKGHSDTVSTLALKTARKLNWTGSDLEYLELAALLHDVGKLSIPETVLSKTQPLTVEERKIIEQHPLYGANIVKPVEPLSRIIPWIYHHQERWDGKGYPERLTKNEIPQGASIISVAEAYTVMTMNLPYRPALTTEDVRANLKDEAGKQFDPQVIEAFLDTEES